MQTALNSFANPLPPASGEAPEFIHLLPAGPSFSGADGRGPFSIDDMAALIARSSGRKLPIDVNHAIDIEGQAGRASPAVGWIVALEARDDGLWGKVEWTPRGELLVRTRAYGFVSPVFTHAKDKGHRIIQVLRAALTNDPNLTTLTALHNRNQETSEMENELREALGLPETADQAAILAAVRTAHQASTAQAALMSRIAEAAGVAKDATGDQIVTALQTRGGDDDEVAELRGQVKELNTRLTTAVTEAATTKAKTVVDAAIEAGKIVPALRDRFIARHIKDPADVEAEIKLMPSLHAAGLGNRRVVDPTGESQLTDTDAQVVQAMGLDPKEFAAQAKLQREAL